QFDALQDACTNMELVGGCAPYPWLGAYSTPSSAPHELTHVLVGQKTKRAVPPRLLQEGIAHYLEGERFIAFQDRFDYDLRAALDEIEGNRIGAHAFVAWFVEREGIDEFLRIYEELGPLADDDYDGFAQAFGYSTLAELQGEFERTGAF